jgi:ABC-type amino acid transport substrate-binding protein
MMASTGAHTNKPHRLFGVLGSSLLGVLCLGMLMGFPALADDDDAPVAPKGADTAKVETPEDVAWARVHSTKILRVGVYRKFAPFHEDGQGGIDDDIGAELARRLGVNVTVISYLAGDEMEDDFRNIIWKGHYLGIPVSDVMLHVPTDEALAKSAPQVQIFGAYAKEETIVAYDKDRLSNWKGMESLGSLRLGVEMQSMPDLYLSSFGAQYNSQIDHFPQLTEAVAELKAGKLQVVLGSRSKTESAIGPDRDRFVFMQFKGGIYGRALNLGVAVNKGETKLKQELQNAITAMRTDGALQKIYAKHFATWVAPD